MPVLWLWDVGESLGAQRPAGVRGGCDGCMRACASELVSKVCGGGGWLAYTHLICIAIQDNLGQRHREALALGCFGHPAQVLCSRGLLCVHLMYTCSASTILLAIRIQHVVRSGLHMRTGVWFNLGSTAAFTTHASAVQTLLNKSRCLDVQCEEQFPELVAAAQRRGLASLQFLQHADQRCGNLGVEILDVNGNGARICGSHYRAGWNASRPCACDDSGKLGQCANCDVGATSLATAL